MAARAIVHLDLDAFFAAVEALENPELAGKQMETNTLTAESTNEQKKAGLTNCTPEELEQFFAITAKFRRNLE